MAEFMTWDQGDSEPEGVTHVHDLISDDEEEPTHWGRTATGEWKGHKGGYKVYLTWPELVRRWGPLEQRGPRCEDRVPR